MSEELNIEQIIKQCKDTIAGHKKRGNARYQKLHDYYIDKPQCEVDLPSRRELEDMVVADMCEPWEICLSTIKQLQAQHRWIPVSERLPEIIEDGAGCFSEDVLVLTANKIWLKASYYKKTGWRLRYIHYSKRQIEKLNITHWMPIPPLPAKEQG